ncbi:MAG: PAS domain S-box protein [Myxococcales bacterium]|nr:PAS domain S-box protein [Myxococcales bacterium]
MTALHPVLERQLRKAAAGPDVPPAPGEPWRAFLERIAEIYVQADQDRYTLERAIAISSGEMQELNARLATERDRLYVTIASMGDGLCVLNADGLVETANPAAERLLAAPPGGLTGKDFVSVVSGFWPPEMERRKSLRELRSAIRSSGACRFDDARFMTLTREWIPVSFALSPIDGSHVVSGSVVIFSDIRQRKKSEDALRESESRFRAIFESAAVGFVHLSLDGTIAECNRTLSEMLGHERERLLGQSVFAHLHPDEVAGSRAGFERLKAEVTTSHKIEIRYLHKDGSTVWALQALSFVRDPDGVPVFAIGVIENVTARKNLEISLRQAQKLEAVGQLAAGIAHEINTPVQFVSDSVHFVRDAVGELLGLLRAYAGLREAAAPLLPDLAAELQTAEEDADLDYLSEKLPRALERALDGLQRVATIVGGMKAFAHPDQREMAPSDLNHAIQTTLTIARNEYKYVAEVETDFGDLPRVVCHVGELNQVFLNIIVNAAHAIGDVVRGTETKGRIRVRTWCEDGSAFVAISDTGGGIPEGIRHRIFDPFFTTKEVGRGTGQGLAIARSVVVEKHRGELTFESAIGQGTTFTIRLPLEQSDQGSKAA